MIDSSKVMLGNKEDYEMLKEHRRLLLNYDKVLEFCPLYDEIRFSLKKKCFISLSKVQKVFEEEYKNTSLYHRLLIMGVKEADAFKLMSASMNYNFLLNKLEFDRAKSSAIIICDLIDYIGHYPKRYPVPHEDEKNPKMEELLEKYDIMVRYYMLDDLNKMQIVSDDVVRLLETLKKYLEIIEKLDEYILQEREWMFFDSMNIEGEFFVGSNRSLEVLDLEPVFPKSLYQEEGKSRREEGKMYLRRNFGLDVI